MIAGNETPVLLHDLPGVIAESDVPSFLAPYGYKARPPVFPHASWLLYIILMHMVDTTVVASCSSLEHG